MLVFIHTSIQLEMNLNRKSEIPYLQATCFILFYYIITYYIVHHVILFTGQCDLPLGVEDNSIQDSDMTASSVWDLNHVPSFGRLNKVRSGYYIGGWAAKIVLPGEWIQV